MLPPTYHSVAKQQSTSAKKESSNVKFYIGMLVSLALLSLLGFYAHYKPLAAKAKAFVQSEEESHSVPALKPLQTLGCVRKPEPVSISKGNEIFTTEIPPGYYVLSFYVRMDTSSSNGPILWIGNSETDEQPELYWYTDGDLDVEWDTGFFHQTHYSNADIFKGNEYFVRVTVSGLDYHLFVNGVSKGVKTMGSANKGSPGIRGVYAYPPWKNFPSLKGTLRDVRVCGVKCGIKSGPVAITKGQQLFRFFTGYNYDLKFRVTMDSSSGNGPIVWIGDSETDEQPEVYWYTDGDVDVEWDTGSFHQFHYSNADIVKGTEFAVKVEVRGLSYELFVDGNSKGKKYMPSSTKGAPRERGIWSYPSWKNYPSLKGTLRDVIVCNV